jgi:ribosomal protein L12E/L44/L45/RPP1/RPP2
MRTHLLMLLLLVCALPVQAAEAPAEADTAATADTAASADSPAEATADETDEETEEAAAQPSLDGGFVPSVQISEDLSVSFPTDI